MKSRVCVLVATCLSLLLPTATSEAKPRRVDGKGVVYVLELRDDASQEPTYLAIDPGRDAWQATATDSRGGTPIRFGAGMQWTFLRDSRYSVHQGFGYFEAEPLAGRSFAEAAEQHQEQLPDLWERKGITLNRIVNVKQVKRLKVAGCRTPGVQILQDVTVRSNGAHYDVRTVLFEMSVHIVALTFRGRSDYLTTMLKGLQKVKPRIWKKPQEVHVVDVQGSPSQNTCIVLQLPLGYRARLTPVELEDKAVVGRWYRPEEGADRPSRELALRRLSLDPNQSVGEAVEAQLTRWKEGGAEVSALRGRNLGDHTGVCADYRLPGATEAEPGKAGWLLAWKTPHAVYALVLECLHPLGGTRSALCAEGEAILEDFQTWEAEPKT